MASDDGLFGSPDQSEHDVIIEDNYSGNNGYDVEGGLDQHESGDEDNDIFEDFEHIFDDRVNLLVILSKMENTWFNLSEMKGACVRVYHFMDLFDNEVMAFS